MTLQATICSFLQIGSSCSTVAMDKFLIEYILIPSVFLLAFIHIMAQMMMKGHGGIKSEGLMSITILIGMIYYGLYGMFALIIVQWFKLLLIGGLFYFLFTRFIKHEWLGKAAGVSARIGEQGYDISILKGRLDMKKREVDRLNDWVKKADVPRRNKEAVRTFINEANVELDIIEEQLNKSGLKGAVMGKTLREDAERRFNYIENLIEKAMEEMHENPEFLDFGTVRAQINILREGITELKNFSKSNKGVSKHLRRTAELTLDQEKSELDKLEKRLKELRKKKNFISKDDFEEGLKEIYEETVSISNQMYATRKMLSS